MTPGHRADHQCGDGTAQSCVSLLRMSSDLEGGEVCVNVRWEKRIYLLEKVAPLCNMAIVGRNERSRNSRELCRYGNNSKERDAEMERDMYCLQRWTNIFVGNHTSSLDGVFFFFLMSASVRLSSVE